MSLQGLGCQSQLYNIMNVINVENYLKITWKNSIIHRVFNKGEILCLRNWKLLRRDMKN